ncbi:hypothetical protein [Rhizobium sp. MHM7A]|uniref:hypothetical protein n=1 Tax=Rhizobium sp. MHM7A TaxID=2583233 RepID=UPI00110594DF|nr:hypothetical protein [Rhizobium sp. MHM7A]TLX17137.1 hypothetical protein FFR93_07450 [Rhizobium sp. MHM7A]
MHKSKLDLFREAVKQRDNDEAIPLAGMIIDVLGDKTPQDVFRFLDKAAKDDQLAAIVCATSFFFREQPKPGHRAMLLRRAARGYDDNLAGNAYFALAAECLVDGGKPRRAIDALERAVELGHLDAHVRLAKGYETGMYRNRINLERAWELLEEAVEEDYGPAKLALAEFIFAHGIHDSDYDPRELLVEAAEDDVPGAVELLMQFQASAETIKRHAKKLDNPVIPRDESRPMAIRSALLNEFHMEADAIEAMVAAWHGFLSWSELIAYALNENAPEGIFDEDCGTEELEDRRRTQVLIAGHYIDAPDYVLELIVTLLQPTSRTHKPSLRNLDRLIGNADD